MNASMQNTRARRTVLAVPGCSTRMLEKSKLLNSDQVFLDLEDSVAPLAKKDARENIVKALNEGGYGSRIRSVRINGTGTQWCDADIETILAGAGHNLDSIILPKVQTVEDVSWLEQRLATWEASENVELGQIGIEVQIEDALGLINVEAIAASSNRIQTIIFGPADFMASVNMRSLNVGAQPLGYTEGDAYHYALMKLLVAGRAFGKQVIDGPYLEIKDLVGLELSSNRSAALGFDGKWVLHPDQIDLVNKIFSPAQAEFEQAELILQAYEYHTSQIGGQLGAVMLGSQMIDEASRKIALVVSAKGRAAGLVSGHQFEVGK